MKTIAFINLKGGVGKTTTAVNVAEILGEHGKRVLLIDADPQANLTSFLLPKQELNTIKAVMDGMADDPYDVIYETGIDNVDLIPADIDLIRADIASICSGARVECILDLLQVLDEDAEAGEALPYDYCIIDCPPSFTAASVAAIYAADDIVIPVKIDSFSIGGMAQLMEQIRGVQCIQPKVKVAGVLVTQWHNAPAVVQGEDILRVSTLPVFDTHIRRSDRVDEASFKRQSLNAYSRWCAAAKDYRAFVAEYLGVE